MKSIRSHAFFSLLSSWGFVSFLLMGRIPKCTDAIFHGQKNSSLKEHFRPLTELMEEGEANDPQSRMNSSFNRRPKRYKYRTYGEIVEHIHALEEKYPNFIDVFSAQERYNLSFPRELQCQLRNGAMAPCHQYVVRVTDEASLPHDVHRPEMFFSGALHGDERVGPQTIVELVEFLAQHASSSPSSSASTLDSINNNNNSNNSNSNENDCKVKNKNDCKRSAQAWIQRLVSTRSIYLMPTTNAFGYDRNTRNERGIDPNRDYNYLRQPKDCMQTMTSRAVNELWRDHMFQLSITFHGGMQAIAYEWGSPNHMNSNENDENESSKQKQHTRKRTWNKWRRRNRGRSQESPDHLAQWYFGVALSKYAGAFSDGQFYPHGSMNDLVYGVEGGMEDWAYAASWENNVQKNVQSLSSSKSSSSRSSFKLNPFLRGQPIGVCRPLTYGGYAEDRTQYNNATHRAFNILVETSDVKEPAEGDLGDDASLQDERLNAVYLPASQRIGHVPRNLRLSLLYIDLLQPYLTWINVASMPRTAAVEHDTKESQESTGSPRFRTPSLPGCSKHSCRRGTVQQKTLLQWKVMGAFTVDETFVQVQRNVPFNAEEICSHATNNTKKQSGVTQWFHNEHHQRLVDKNASSLVDPKRPSSFQEEIQFEAPGTYYVRACAMVDQDWMQQASGVNTPSPNVPPQTHIVNARTNPAWFFEHKGRRIQGQRYWTSEVIKFVIHV